MQRKLSLHKRRKQQFKGRGFDVGCWYGLLDERCYLYYDINTIV